MARLMMSYLSPSPNQNAPRLVFFVERTGIGRITALIWASNGAVQGGEPFAGLWSQSSSPWAVDRIHVFDHLGLQYIAPLIEKVAKGMPVSSCVLRCARKAHDPLAGESNASLRVELVCSGQVVCLTPSKSVLQVLLRPTMHASELTITEREERSGSGLHPEPLTPFRFQAWLCRCSDAERPGP